MQSVNHFVTFQVDLSSWEAKIDEDQESTPHGDTCSSEEELLGEATGEEQDCSYQERTEYGDGVLTIGCIGIYHNHILWTLFTAIPQSLHM